MSAAARRGPALRRMAACPGCDLLHVRVALPARTLARCRRCGCVLHDTRALDLEPALALTLAAALLFVLSAAFPLLRARLGGVVQASGLASGVAALWSQGEAWLALLVLATTLAVPALRLAALLWVLGSLRLRLRPPGLVLALRLVGRLREWAMLEVFLLGAIVAWIKLEDLAEVSLGPSMAAFGALVLALAAANAALDPRDAWDALERLP